MSSVKRLKKIWTLFFRSFFIQSFWNYRSLISIGLCYTMMPLKKMIYQNKEEEDAFVRQNLQFFNSHPYFSAYAIGVLYRLYEDDPNISSEKIEKVKNLLISPLGALGDTIFWDMVKPACLLMAVSGGLLQLMGYPGWALIVLAFLFYNIPHFYVRWNGIKQGYEYGLNIYQKLNFESFEKLYKLYQNVGRAFIVVNLFLLASWSIVQYNVVSVFVLVNILFGLGAGYFKSHFYLYVTGIFLLNFIGIILVI